MIGSPVSDAQSLHDRAVAAESAGELSLAESLFRQAVELEPHLPEPHFNLCLFFQNHKRTDAAVMEYRALVSRFPVFHPAQQNLGILLMEQGDAASAAQHYRGYCAACPQEPTAHAGLAQSLLAKGDCKSALVAVERALRLRPKAPDLFRLHALILAGLNRSLESGNALLRAISLRPDYAEVHADLGDFYLGVNQPEKAREHFGRTLALNPSDKRAATGLWYANPGWQSTLRGRNLLLRPLKAADAEAIFAWQQTERWNLFNRGRFQKLRERLQTAERSSVLANGYAEWMVMLAGQRIGLASLIDINGAERRAEFQVGIFGVPEDARGYGLQATLMTMGHAFDVLGFSKIYLYIYADNQLARRSADSFGFSHDGVLRAHLTDPRTDEALDLHLYSMLAAEWRKNERTQRLYQRLAVQQR